MGCSHPQQDIKLTQAPPICKEKSKIQLKISPGINNTSNDGPSDEEMQFNRGKQKQEIREDKEKMYSSPLFEQQMNAFIDSVFQTYDTNKNGVLSINEFARLLRQQNSAIVINDQQVEQCLEIADFNKDRLITKSELRTLYAALLKY